MEKIKEILDFGTNQEKIEILESLSSSDNIEIIKQIILKLDDESIQVRGEAFSALVSNENKISEVLISNLTSRNKNIRGHVALVLANRKDIDAIPDIIKLTMDTSSMVRACAIGSLGHLKTRKAENVILNSLFDSNLEVRKSALQAMINLGLSLSKDKADKISTEQDPELERLLISVKKESGPKGI